MDTLEFRCPACNKTLKMQARFAGRTGRCPNCDTRMHVPEADEEGSENSSKPDQAEAKIECELCKTISPAAGRIRCPECGTPMRPLFISILVIFAFIGVSTALLPYLKVLESPQSHPQPQVFLASIAIIMIALAMWFFIGLWRGRFYAWVGIQVTWAVDLLVLALHIEMAGGILVLLLSVPRILLIAYLWRKNVRAFCSA